MKKIILPIILSAVVLLSALPAYALTTGAVDRMQEKASAAATRQDLELSRIQTRARTLIQTRLATLEKLQTRVQNDKRLSSDEQTSFVSSITTTIASLQSLQTKIDADTDATTALSDAKSIVTSYRIYEIFEPKLRLTVIIDNLQNLDTNLTALVTKVQTLLDTLKNQGKDVSNSQTALNDISTQLTAISTTLTADKSLLSGVAVGTSNPQSIFTQVRKDLATVRSDFAKIRNDFATIRSDVQIILPKGQVTTKPASNSAQ